MNDPAYLFTLEEGTEVFTATPMGVYSTASRVATYDAGEETTMHTKDGEAVDAVKLPVEGGHTYVPKDAIKGAREL